MRPNLLPRKFVNRSKRRPIVVLSPFNVNIRIADTAMFRHTLNLPMLLTFWMIPLKTDIFFFTFTLLCHENAIAFMLTRRDGYDEALTPPVLYVLLEAYVQSSTDRWILFIFITAEISPDIQAPT